MGLWIGVALLIALVWWLFLPRRRTARAPEDDVRSPIDRDELAEAERDLERDPRARPLEQGWDDEEDDWGPGAR
jgi:hypothetical protein